MSDPPVINVDVDVDMTAAVGAMEAAQVDIEQELNIIIVTPVVQDPRLDFVETSPTRPSCANPTNDNHRFDVIVKTPDETQLHLGQAGPDGRITDTGLAGRTKSHIHWEVRNGGSGAAAAPTVVSMGLGSNDATVISAFDGNVPTTASQGFSMVTGGKAFLNSNKQMLLACDTEDVQVRAVEGKVVVQADANEVEVHGSTKARVLGGNQVEVAAHPNNIPCEDARYGATWDSVAGDITTNDITKYGLKIADWAKSAEALFLGVVKVEKDSETGKRSWSTKAPSDVPKFIVDCTKLALSLGRAFGDSDDGRVKIKAHTYASMVGETAASIAGGLSASMTSLVSSSVLGGTAGLTGVAWASIWSGLGTSVKSRNGAVSVESQKNKASLKGKKEVEVSSSDGPAKVTGKGITQLNSTNDTTWVHSPAKVLCTAGSDAGYGFEAKGEHVRVGVFASSTGDAKQAKVDPGRCIEHNKDGIEAKYDTTSLSLQPHYVHLTAKKDHGFMATTSDVIVCSNGKVLLK